MTPWEAIVLVNFIFLAPMGFFMVCAGLIFNDEKTRNVGGIISIPVFAIGFTWAGMELFQAIDW